MQRSAMQRWLVDMFPGEGYENVQARSDSGGLAFKVRFTIGSQLATCWVNSQCLGRSFLEIVIFVLLDP